MKSQRIALILMCLVPAACGSKQTAEPPQQSEQGTTTATQPQAEWTWTASNAQQFWAAWRPATGPVEMGPSFAIEIQLATEKAGVPLDLTTDQIEIGARMPEHQHGMLQTTQTTRIGPGRYRVDGMRFHMLGYWQIHLDVTQAPITERAQFDLQL